MIYRRCYCEGIYVCCINVLVYICTVRGLYVQVIYTQDVSRMWLNVLVYIYIYLFIYLYVDHVERFSEPLATLIHKDD